MSDTKATVKLFGNLKSAYNTQNKDDNGNVTKSTNIISLYREGLAMEDDTGERKEGGSLQEVFDTMYKGVAKKWIPDWYKEDKDFMSVKSSYNIPCKIDDEGIQMSFAEFVERGNIRDAEVIVKCNVKDSTLYPNAMLIVTEGKPYDAFENF